jgi:hypothetical protein
MTSVFALAGGSVEVGHVYFAYQRLVVSTNAATWRVRHVTFSLR